LVLTVWSARIAAALYVCALALSLRGQLRLSRVVYTAGLVTFLLHVWAAFEYFYSWSHAVAYRETERQTAALFGVDWGGGIYLNYLFTAVWFADCAMWWLRPERWRPRIAVQAFLLFMVVNGTIVVWVLRALL
jgi:hypothetical protein